MHPGKCRKIGILRRFVDDVFIDFIDDGKGIILFDKGRNGKQFFFRKNLTARIRRGTNKDCLRPLFKGRF